MLFLVFYMKIIKLVFQVKWMRLKSAICTIFKIINKNVILSLLMLKIVKVVDSTR